MNCPHCGTEIGGRMTMAGERAEARAGDLAVCLYCARLSIYEAPDELRRLTEAERFQLHSREDVRDAISRVKRARPQLVAMGVLK